MAGTNNQSVKMALETLRLYPGSVMYIQRQAEGLHHRHKVNYIGFIKNKSLLVTLPFESNNGMWMQVGHTFVVRGFNGIYAYAFSTQVIRARAQPFSYIHFSWPWEVDCQLVRKSLRVDVDLSANCTRQDNRTVAVTMLDLSSLGSMLNCTAPLGALGDPARIEFAVDFEGNTTKLDLAIIVRNIHLKEDGSGFHIGVFFENVAQNDALILHYFINNLALGANP